jgi:menaquinone-dependent protoporphyrinogen oxidase
VSILVAYASKHGATQGIAERIAATLGAAGHPAQALAVSAVDDVESYDGFVIGSAVYLGKWRKDATEFVRRHEAVLAVAPVWLFSSGPLGTATQDDQGRDLVETSKPKEFAEFAESITPRDLRVFFGALDPATPDSAGRLLRLLPAGRNLLPEGDFRDWAAIDAWAETIARDLPATP